MREAVLANQARFERPGWAVQLLGPLPTSRSGEAAWLAAAGAIAAYRERWQPAPANRGQPVSTRTARIDHLRRVRAILDELHHTTASKPSARPPPASRNEPTITATSHDRITPPYRLNNGMPKGLT
jgi:hypothetical protein